MDPDQSQQIAAVADEIEAIIGNLQYAVLNNLDTYVHGKGIDREILDTFVKRPIMQSVTKLKRHKVLLVKMALDAKTTESKEVTTNAPRR
jgi:hypothetical protein